MRRSNGCPCYDSKPPLGILCGDPRAGLQCSQSPYGWARGHPQLRAIGWWPISGSYSGGPSMVTAAATAERAATSPKAPATAEGILKCGEYI